MERKRQTHRLGAATRSADDWEEAALDAIASGGLRSVAIPALATTLGVTKGSFYWHFGGLEALIAAALRRWEAAEERRIAQLAAIADPAARLRAAFDDAMAVDRAQALYVTLAASTEPAIVPVMRQVSRRRLRFLTAAYAELGLTPADARERAFLTLSAYIGAIHVRRQSIDGLRSARDVEMYVAHAAQTLIPKPKRRA